MIRLGAVGDVVRTLPAVSVVRASYPKARITWLVEPASADLVRGQPWVDETLVFPRGSLRESLVRARWVRFSLELAQFRRELRQHAFDLVLDFHSILKSGLLSLATGSARRVAYAAPFGRELSWLFATERAELEPEKISRFERNDALVRFLGLTVGAATIPLRLDDDRVRRMEKELGTSEAPVVLHPGTSPSTPYKRYPAAAFGAVARGLAETESLRCLVTHGPAPGERELAQAVVEASAGAAELAPATPRLLDLAALFSRCRLYVGGDTGPTHVASLVGTPVVQILGPTDPVENAPYPGTPARTVRVPVHCSPCRRGCAAAFCMSGVPPGTVLDAARELLAGSA